MVRLTVRGVVFSALFAALLVVFSFLRVDVGPVPIVLENIVPLLAGALLGPMYGFFSMLLILVLVAAGVPILGGSGGFSIFLGPSGGYVVGWAVVAWLIGLVLPRLRGARVMTFILGFVVVEVVGVFLEDALGAAWLMHVLHYSLQRTLASGFYIFLPGDTVKALVTTIVWSVVREIYPVTRLVGPAGQSVVKLADESQG
ncbi:MAG: biotin transporter BioY [Alicyclobacillus sp.]|nr:biotin transporter BioY [Alicyclobacillus sp.]